MSKLPSYSIPCPMKPIEISSLIRMISLNPNFLGIRIIPDLSRTTIAPKEGYIPVIMKIPRRIDMIDFNRNLIEAISQESTTLSHGEKKR
jgi:hypothetical protein